MATVFTEVSGLLRAFNMPKDTPVKKDNPYEGKIDFGIPADKGLYKSYLGTTVVADISFLGATYTNSKGKEISFADFKIATVLVDVSQRKIIELTQIQGSDDGTVKEYIGLGDYDITINGIIFGSNGVYPFDAVRALKDVCDAPITISIVSRHLQNLDIYSLVITDYDIPQEAGGYSQQPFTLNCLSDNPTELIVSDL